MLCTILVFRRGFVPVLVGQLDVQYREGDGRGHTSCL